MNFQSSLQAADWLEWTQAHDLSDERLRCVFIGDACDAYSQPFCAELLADADASAYLQAGFRCLQADRRQQPVLAERVQLVLATSGARGWPAVAFCLPDGTLIGAVPYGPVRDGDKRPGLIRVAMTLQETWQQEPQALRDEAELLTSMARQMLAGGDLPNANLTFDRIDAVLMDGADSLEGGFGKAPRWAQPALWNWLCARATDPDVAPSLQQQVERSAAALLAGAQHDHLAGGFFNGVQDQAWAQPFFEKTVLSNAHIIRSLLLAATATGREAFRQAAIQAADWCLRVCVAADGQCRRGLAARSTAGDGELAAGAVYAWSEAAVAEIIGSDGAALFSQRYLADERSAIDAAGLWRLPMIRGQLAAADLEKLPALCYRLAVARQERQQPACIAESDVLGRCVLLRALIDLSTATGDPRWQQAVEQLSTAVERHQPQMAGERLWRCWALVAAVVERPELRAVVLTEATNLAAVYGEHDGVVLEDPIWGWTVSLACDADDQLAAPAIWVELCRDLAALTGEQVWSDRAWAGIQAAAPIWRDAPQAALGLASQWYWLESRSVKK